MKVDVHALGQELYTAHATYQFRGVFGPTMEPESPRRSPADARVVDCDPCDRCERCFAVILTSAMSLSGCWMSFGTMKVDVHAIGVHPRMRPPESRGFLGHPLLSDHRLVDDGTRRRSSKSSFAPFASFARPLPSSSRAGTRHRIGLEHGPYGRPLHGARRPRGHLPTPGSTERRQPSVVAPLDAQGTLAWTAAAAPSRTLGLIPQRFDDLLHRSFRARLPSEPGPLSHDPRC
jgi:hypothetical protein